MASDRKLTDDDALALVLSGIKGEIPLSDLCRRYGVSQTTYYKLRDRFLAAGTAGMRSGKVPEVKVLEDRVRDLERALGRKTMEVEILKKTEEIIGRRPRS
jgi:transposase-like protein